MTITAENALELINSSDQITDDERLDVFEYLSQLYVLIPLRDGFSTDPKEAKALKAPIHPGWNKPAPNRPQFDRETFSKHRAGIVCGPDSGLLVLDIDDSYHFQNWYNAEGLNQPLPKTMTVRTGGKGERFHYYFNYPDDGQKYGNRAHKGIFDIRGEGGYVICPGSLHPETNKPYIVCDSAPIVEAPAWLKNYCLYKNVLGPNNSGTINTTEKATEMTNSNLRVTPPAIDLENIPVSPKVKEIIKTKFPIGERSENSMSALIGLLSAGMTKDQIIQIYETMPIGDKYRDQGENRTAWLEREIGTASQYIESVKGHIPPNPFDQAPQMHKYKFQYKVFNGLDVFNSNTQFNFLIENFWPDQEALLLTGYGGSGKSILSLQLALDLALGYASKLFLDYFKILGQRKTLFIQSENTIFGLKQRLTRMMNAYPTQQAALQDSIFFLGINEEIRSMGDFLSEPFLDQIRSTVGSRQASILIIDPLISFHSQDENSNDQMRRLLDSIGLFCEEIKVTPMIIHHHAKVSTGAGPGGGRGASAIGDWSPNTWELEFTKKNGFELTHKKARNFEKRQDKLSLILNQNDLRFKVKAATAILSNDVQLVVNALTNLGGKASSQKELKNQIIAEQKKLNNLAISDGTARKRIEEAVKAGAIKEAKIENLKTYSLP